MWISRASALLSAREQWRKSVAKGSSGGEHC